MKRRKKNKTKKNSRSSKKGIRNRDGSKKDQVNKRQAKVLPPGKDWVKSDMTWTDAVSTNDGNDILSDSEYFGELKIERYQNQHNQTSMFCSLPDEILLMIFEILFLTLSPWQQRARQWHTLSPETLFSRCFSPDPCLP